MPVPSRSTTASNTQLTISHLEPAHTHNHDIISSDILTREKKTIETSRVDFALSIPMEDIQLMSKAAWAVKVRRNPNKGLSIREVDVRYSTNNETLRAVLH